MLSPQWRDPFPPTPVLIQDGLSYRLAQPDVLTQNGGQPPPPGEFLTEEPAADHTEAHSSCFPADAAVAGPAVNRAARNELVASALHIAGYRPLLTKAMLQWGVPSRF